MSAVAKKVTMGLTARDINNADWLQDKMHARSKAAVVSNSLEITTKLSEVLQKGGHLLVENPDGTIEKLVITGL